MGAYTQTLSTSTSVQKPEVFKARSNQFCMALKSKKAQQCYKLWKLGKEGGLYSWQRQHSIWTILSSYLSSLRLKTFGTGVPLTVSSSA